MESIAMYKEFYNSNDLPSVFDNISDETPILKDKILNYLKSKKPSSASPKTVVDIFNGKRLNFELTCSNDGLFYWRSDMVYYFEKYNLKLNESFIKHILKN